jgi:hypothetical protein
MSQETRCTDVQMWQGLIHSLISADILSAP